MEGSTVQDEKDEEKEEEDNRGRGGEERSDRASTGERPAAPNKDDGRTETKCCRHSKERVDRNTEKSHAPSLTAIICGDSNIERGLENVLCGGADDG
jgi:hypothetical protein